MSNRLLCLIMIALMFVLSHTGCRNPRPAPVVYPPVGFTPTPSEDIYPPPGGDPAKAGQWVCPMHPQVRQSEPGKCSMCGMDLIRSSESSGADQRSSESEHSHSPETGRSQSSGSGGGCCG